jgi:hypothetical protein
MPYLSERPAGLEERTEGTVLGTVRRATQLRAPALIGVLVILCLAGYALWSGRPSSQVPDAGPGPSATVPSERPAPSPWKLVKAFDFSSNNGWTDTGLQATRDASTSRLRQARFGTGPQGTWLTVTAERARNTAPVYSADLLGRAFPIPNYFAVDLVYRLPDVGVGMWPAPLWLRPLETRHDPTPEGEIDVVEWFGSRVQQFDEAAGSIHKTPYGAAHRQLPLALPALAGLARSRDHHIRFEKTPGAMTWWVDGLRAGSLTRQEFDHEAAAPGTWNAMFERPRRQWYPRITYQVGPGVDGNQAGPIPADWRASHMIIKRLDVYAPTS